jgi:ribose transport system substrate-binding protein
MQVDNEASARTRRRSKCAGVVAATCLVALLLSACGSSHSTSTQSAGSTANGSTTANTSGDLATFEKLVAAGEKPIAAFDDYGPTTPVKPVSSARIVVVSCAQTADGCSRPATGVTDAAKELGWTASVIDGMGIAADYQSGIEAAIAKKPDAIVLTGIDMSLVCPQIADARKQGIPIISINALSPVNNVCGADASIDPDSMAMGEALAAKSIVDSDGKAHAIVGVNAEFQSVTTTNEGVLSDYAQCPTCSVVAKLSVQVAALATSFPTLVASTAQRNPDANVVIDFDAANTYSNPALQSAGLLNTHVKVYGYDGNSDQVAAVRDGDVQATAAAPWEWGGWAAVDLIARKLAGDKAWASTPHRLPWKLITKENAPAQGSWQGDVDYQAAFEKLWGR